MTERRICQCGATFELSDRDRAYFEARGWKLPQRCFRCRFDRRPLRGGMYHPLGGEFNAGRS